MLRTTLATFVLLGSTVAVRAADPDVAALAAQVKELQKQVAALQGQSRIVASGTATWTRPDVLTNGTSVHVALPAEIAARLGKDDVVLLTNRLPQSGYPYFAPSWSPSQGGFEITLVETTLANGGAMEYARAGRTYLVDWVVVRR